jgi:hypothetical protein
MLFHIKMTHTTENCPGYWPPDEQKKFFSGAEDMLATAKEKGVEIHFMVTGVGHNMYALVEADDFHAINMFFSGMGFKQDYQIEPVGSVKDIISMFKAELAKQ